MAPGDQEEGSSPGQGLGKPLDPPPTSLAYLQDPTSLMEAQREHWIGSTTVFI